MSEIDAAKISELRGLLADILHWAETRCPCENEEPKICPLCDANVDDPNGICLSAERTIPPRLLSRLRLSCDIALKALATDQPKEGGVYDSHGTNYGVERKRLKDRIDLLLNNHLVEMREGYDDSIVGFNEAWDIVRSVFADMHRTHAGHGSIWPAETCASSAREDALREAVAVAKMVSDAIRPHEKEPCESVGAAKVASALSCLIGKPKGGEDA